MGYGIPSGNGEDDGGSSQTATTVVGTITTSGTTQIVASPGAGRFIRIHFFTWLCDPDSTTIPMVTMKSSGGTNYHLASAAAKTWQWDLPPNQALQLVLSQAATGDGVGYTVYYTIEDV